MAELIEVAGIGGGCQSWCRGPEVVGSARTGCLPVLQLASQRWMFLRDKPLKRNRILKVNVFN